MTALFRQAAIDARLSPLAGATRMPQPAWQTAVAWLALVFVAAAASVLAFGRLAPTTEAMAYIDTDSGNVAVHAPAPGVVAQLLVAEGERVAGNQPLAVIAPADGRARYDALLAEIERELLTIDAQQRALDLRFDADAGERRQRIAAGRDQLAALDTRVALLDADAQMTDRAAGRTKQLFARGVATQGDLDTARRAVLAVHARYADLMDAKRQVASDLALQELALSALPANRDAERARLSRTASTLRQRRIELRHTAATTLRAPASGRVSAIQTRVGRRADPAEPLLVLLPHHRGVHAEVLVPADQAVDIAIDTLISVHTRDPTSGGPSRHTARVVDIPDAPVTRYRGRQLPAPALVLRAALDPAAAVALTPGMLVSARVRHPPRRLMDWLIEPAERLVDRLRTARAGTG